MKNLLLFIQGFFYLGFIYDYLTRSVHFERGESWLSWQKEKLIKAWLFKVRNVLETGGNTCCSLEPSENTQKNLGKRAMLALRLILWP